jgi:catechol 2,3-dioxygenase-like lactoylglutathione lyase family enzyme
MSPIGGGARRVLHFCYVCGDVDRVGELFAALGMQERMRSEVSTRSGALLGLDRDVTGIATFLYDARGPRVSPAIEVHGWFDPVPEGEPYTTPNQVGIQAIGIAVPDAEVGVSAITRLGCKQIGKSEGSSVVFSDPTILVRDERGVGIDVVSRPDVAASECVMGHIRLTCSDLERSLAWYSQIGWEVVQPAVRCETPGGVFGLDQASVELNVARMRLPDEPTELLLTEWLSPRSTGTHYEHANHLGLFRMALGVDDTRKIYDEATRDGWSFHAPPMNRKIGGTNIPDMWIAMTRDPDNIPVEFVERPRSAFRDPEVSGSRD